MNNSAATSPSILLSAHGLTCIRQDRVLFADLNFSLAAGDIVQVEGPNGVGKTSLLRILAGLAFPHEGEIRYQGQPVDKVTEEFHQDLLYLGHQAGVKGELTANENLSFLMRLNDQHTDPEVVEDTLSEVDLGGFEEAFASQLSAGQHRRIALSRLWRSHHKVWILDEPFTAIDKSGVMKLEQLFAQHIAAGGAIVLTTHQDFNLLKDKVKTLTLNYRYESHE